MKKSIKVLLIFTLGTIFGVSLLITYASTYNSEEISYDNSNSHAEAENVKDAIDYLYSHGSCGEGMSCLESPTVIINVEGPGIVTKNDEEITSITVPINGSNTFIVTPNSGYALHSISCDNGYTLGNFKTIIPPNDEALYTQTITITNPSVVNGAICNIVFGVNGLNVSSTHINMDADTCNGNSSGCICYQIAHNISNFTYEGHTDCNFKSKTCQTNSGVTFDCQTLAWIGGKIYRWASSNTSIDSSDKAICSGVVTCAT